MEAPNCPDSMVGSRPGDIYQTLQPHWTVFTWWAPVSSITSFRSFQMDSSSDPLGVVCIKDRWAMRNLLPTVLSLPLPTTTWFSFVFCHWENAWKWYGLPFREEGLPRWQYTIFDEKRRYSRRTCSRLRRAARPRWCTQSQVRYWWYTRGLFVNIVGWGRKKIDKVVLPLMCGQ